MVFLGENVQWLALFFSCGEENIGRFFKVEGEIFDDVNFLFAASCFY